MRLLLSAARPLLQDLASTILFLILFALTHNLAWSVVLALALAVGQIGRQLVRHKKADALQWVSLVVVIASGTGALISHNPVFVMLKPSAIYLLVGAAMLQRGWMERYLPPVAREMVPDLAVTFGYVWAGLMFFSAALNLWAALDLGVVAWGALMAGWGIASKSALFLVQFGAMRLIGRRRYRMRLAIA